MSADKNSSNASVGAQYTTFICNDDVILGRGLSSVKHPGNIFFRNLIKEKRAKYASSCRRQLKQDVSKEVLSIMLQRNTRFVRELKSEELIDLGHLSTNATKLWFIADHSTVLQKIKQALREFECKSEKKKETRNVSQHKVANHLHTYREDPSRGATAAWVQTETLTSKILENSSFNTVASNINPFQHQSTPGRHSQRLNTLLPKL